MSKCIYDLSEDCNNMDCLTCVLNKIRTDIDNINLNEVATKYEDRFYGFQQEVIKILDKYKAENEPQGSEVEE